MNTFSPGKRHLTLSFVIFVIAFIPALAQGPADIQLPLPQTDGGRPLVQVLNDRQSIRDFRRDKLPLQTLSNLLWAGFGIKRPDSRRSSHPARKTAAGDRQHRTWASQGS